MSMETFSGTTSEYTVVGERGGAKFGVSIRLQYGGTFVIRFATYDMEPTPPTYFTCRGTAPFVYKGVKKMGAYLDKCDFPVVEKPISPDKFLQVIEDLDFVSIMSEWVINQFKKEGVDIEPTVVIEKLFYDALPKEEAKPVLCFQIPSDLSAYK